MSGYPRLEILTIFVTVDHCRLVLDPCVPRNTDLVDRHDAGAIIGRYLWILF